MTAAGERLERALRLYSAYEDALRQARREVEAARAAVLAQDAAEGAHQPAIDVAKLRELVCGTRERVSIAGFMRRARPYMPDHFAEAADEFIRIASDAEALLTADWRRDA